MSERLTFVECAPGGYPTFGLVSRSLHVPQRADASPVRLRASLERWERQHQGSYGFEFRSLDDAPLELAQEAAHVYIALRERHPLVTPSYVDLASRQIGRWYGQLKPDSQPLAVATTTEFLAPLREASIGRQQPQAVLNTLPLDHPMRVEAAFAASQARELRLRDVWSSGGIDLCRSFASRRAYRELLALREKARPRPSHLPRRVVQHHLGVLGYALVHEFGHLIEGELLMLGTDAVEHVYGEVSRALLDLDVTPSARRWSQHLVNYPTRNAEPGRFAGGKDRARRLRDGVGQQVAWQLGSYAASCRDELFAEAFVASWAAKDQGLRVRLRRMRSALADVALAVKRLPPV